MIDGLNLDLLFCKFCPGTSIVKHNAFHHNHFPAILDLVPLGTPIGGKNKQTKKHTQPHLPTLLPLPHFLSLPTSVPHNPLYSLCSLAYGNIDGLTFSVNTDYLWRVLGFTANEMRWTRTINLCKNRLWLPSAQLLRSSSYRRYI
jgi:hypothetical protein